MAIQNNTTQNNKAKNSFNLFLKNYFNFILAITLIVFLMAAYFFILAPKYSATTAAIKDSITEQQKLYNAQQKKLANYKDIASLYKKVSPADLKKFNNVLSDAYVKESLFGEIEDIVNQNGFIIDKISVLNPENKEKTKAASDAVVIAAPTNLGEININLSLGTVDYAGFKNLVKIFENNLRLMDISQVNFSADSGTADLTLRTYYYKK
jgi:capsular polysaccharide biosynthesis protein